MNRPTLINILLVATVVVFILVFSLSDDPKPQLVPAYKTGFTYHDVIEIKTSLAKQDIFMSAPTAITDHTIKQYCPSDDENAQKSVRYCTTTALVDSKGEPLGNINMGGTIDGPILALAIIDASPFLDSRDNDVHFVFQTMIETLLCDCWKEEQPGGFESVHAWLDTAKEKYADASHTTLKSKIAGLGNGTIILEITSKEESFLWTLIVLKNESG